MNEPKFDPSGYWEFDLAHGEVRTREGHRVVVMTEAALALLLGTTAERGSLIAQRKLGDALGRMVRAGLTGDISAMSPETVLGHAASVLSLFGWGRLRFERWGSALVLEVDSPPSLADGGESLAALLSAFVSVLGGEEVLCTPLAEGNRFIVSSPATATDIRGWSKQGASVPEMLQRLEVAR